MKPLTEIINYETSISERVLYCLTNMNISKKSYQIAVIISQSENITTVFMDLVTPPNKKIVEEAGWVVINIIMKLND